MFRGRATRPDEIATRRVHNNSVRQMHFANYDKYRYIFIMVNFSKVFILESSKKFQIRVRTV